MGVEDGKPDEALGAYLRRVWLSNVAEISDLGLQRRTWLDRSNLNPHWSYIEFVCSYPDDDQLTDARARGWLTEREFKVLSGLGRTLTAHSAPGGDNYDNATVLDDPAWHTVAAEAQLVKHELLVTITITITITDADERQALLNAE